MADPASVDTDPACASTEHPLSHTCVHLCVDMQRMFAEATDWRTPWMPRVLPRV